MLDRKWKASGIALKNPLLVDPEGQLHGSHNALRRRRNRDRVRPSGCAGGSRARRISGRIAGRGAGPGVSR